MNLLPIFAFGFPLVGAAVIGYLIYQYTDHASPYHNRTSQGTTSSGLGDCSICCGYMNMNMGTTRTLSCGCIFHRGCINKLLVEQRRKSCPNCNKLL